MFRLEHSGSCTIIVKVEQNMLAASIFQWKYMPQFIEVGNSRNYRECSGRNTQER